jgi:hypothetical protein
VLTCVDQSEKRRPLSRPASYAIALLFEEFGAGDGIRTHDPNLGKVARGAHARFFGTLTGYDKLRYIDYPQIIHHRHRYPASAA